MPSVTKKHLVQLKQSMMGLFKKGSPFLSSFKQTSGNQTYFCIKRSGPGPSRLDKEQAMTSSSRYRIAPKPHQYTSPQRLRFYALHRNHTPLHHLAKAVSEAPHPTSTPPAKQARKAPRVVTHGVRASHGTLRKLPSPAMTPTNAAASDVPVFDLYRQVMLESGALHRGVVRRGSGGMWSESWRVMWMCRLANLVGCIWDLLESLGWRLLGRFLPLLNMNRRLAGRLACRRKRVFLPEAVGLVKENAAMRAASSPSMSISSSYKR
jgi:hypothetical protein